MSSTLNDDGRSSALLCAVLPTEVVLTKQQLEPVLLLSQSGRKMNGQLPCPQGTIRAALHSTREQQIEAMRELLAVPEAPLPEEDPDYHAPKEGEDASSASVLTAGKYSSNRAVALASSPRFSGPSSKQTVSPPDQALESAVGNAQSSKANAAPHHLALENANSGTTSADPKGALSEDPLIRYSHDLQVLEEDLRSMVAKRREDSPLHAKPMSVEPSPNVTPQQQTRLKKRPASAPNRKAIPPVGHYHPKYNCIDRRIPNSGRALLAPPQPSLSSRRKLYGSKQPASRVVDSSRADLGVAVMDTFAAPNKEAVRAQQANTWLGGDVDGAACLTADSPAGLSPEKTSGTASFRSVGREVASSLATRTVPKPWCSSDSYQVTYTQVEPGPAPTADYHKNAWKGHSGKMSDPYPVAGPGHYSDCTPAVQRRPRSALFSQGAGGRPSLPTTTGRHGTLVAAAGRAPSPFNIRDSTLNAVFTLEGRGSDSTVLAMARSTKPAQTSRTSRPTSARATTLCNEVQAHPTSSKPHNPPGLPSGVGKHPALRDNLPDLDASFSVGVNRDSANLEHQVHDFHPMEQLEEEEVYLDVEDEDGAGTETTGSGQVLDGGAGLLFIKCPSKPRPHEHEPGHGLLHVRPLSATATFHCATSGARSPRSLARPCSAHVAMRHPGALGACSRPASATANISGRPPSAHACGSLSRGTAHTQGSRLTDKGVEEQQETSATILRPRPQSAVAESSCRQAVKAPDQWDSIKVSCTRRPQSASAHLCHARPASAKSQKPAQAAWLPWSLWEAGIKSEIEQAPIQGLTENFSSPPPLDVPTALQPGLHKVMHFAVPSVPVVEEVVIPPEHHAYLTTIVPKGVLNEFSSSAHLEEPVSLLDCTLKFQSTTSRVEASNNPKSSTLASIQITDADANTDVGLRHPPSEIRDAQESVRLNAPMMLQHSSQSPSLQLAADDKDALYQHALDVTGAGRNGSLLFSRVKSIKQEVRDSRRPGTNDVRSRSVQPAAEKAGAKPTSALSRKGSWSCTTREQARKGSRQGQKPTAHDLQYDVVSSDEKVRRRRQHTVQLPPKENPRTHMQLYAEHR